MGTRLLSTHIARSLFVLSELHRYASSCCHSADRVDSGNIKNFFTNVLNPFQPPKDLSAAAPRPIRAKQQAKNEAVSSEALNADDFIVIKACSESKSI